MILARGARIALQLSYREGFEVKVTEAIQKGIPVIAYEAGGIPLQIVPDVTGFLLPVGDIEGVVDRLYTLTMDNAAASDSGLMARQISYQRILYCVERHVWLHLFTELTCSSGSGDGMLDEEATFLCNSSIGNARKICDLWKAKYSYNPPPKHN